MNRFPTRLVAATLWTLLLSLTCAAQAAQSAVKVPYGKEVLLLTIARVNKLPEAEVPAATAAFLDKVRQRGVGFRMDSATEKEFRSVGATPAMLAAFREAYRPGGAAAPVSAGLLNGKSTSLPQPPYPPVARAARAQGMVLVEVIVDERGAVISAEAVSGHPLLRQAAVAAAREARFEPFRLRGRPVMVEGIITYRFTLQ